MTDLQEKILEGINNMYEKHGELAPTKLFNISDLEKLVELNKIVIVDNPYGIGDDFFGIVGGEYPIGFDQLIKFRNLRDGGGENDVARKSCECITL